jgi:hypothetical protein
LSSFGRVPAGEILSRAQDLRCCGSRTCKPNFVCREAPLSGTTYRRTAIPLGRTLLCGSSDLPEGADAPSRHASAAAGNSRNQELTATAKLPPYLVLLRVGFALPARLLGRRCALAAPFHPYPASRNRASKGGIFSVALSVNRPSRRLPGRYPAHCSAEFGLSSLIT